MRILVPAALLLVLAATWFLFQGEERPPRREPMMDPIKKMDMYLDGVHFYADDMGRQIEAHHYCSMVNENLHRCVIYDGNGPDAKLIGIEYIISEEAFTQLPEEEKKYWHSHVYEVKSGALVMPGMADDHEREMMQKIIKTYGKTWHTWQVDRGDRMPLGIPQLMMAFTKDGQLRPELLQQRDQKLGISTQAKVQSRQDIPAPQIQPGADAWQEGKTLQLKTDEVEVKNLKR